MRRPRRQRRARSARRPSGSFDFKVDATDSAGSTATVTRHYSVVPVTGTPGGETPATLNLTLGAAASFAPFIPGIAKDYTTSMTATLTSTAADATLWVADPSATATGRLVNGAFALAAPLQVAATSPNGVGSAHGRGRRLGRSDQAPDLRRPARRRVRDAELQADDRRHRGAAHRRLRQDAHLHALDDDP